MQGLTQKLLEKMGNKARAEAALKSALNESGLNVDEADSGFEKKRSLLFLLLTLPFTLIMALFYLLMLLINMTCLTLVYLVKGRTSVSTFDDEGIRVLLDHWGKYPFCFITKMTELSYYRRWLKDTPPLSNSLEIGVYTGETSRAFFHGQEFKYGVEYNIDRLRFYRNNGSHHKKLISADIRFLPLPESSLDSVYCVHSIDDMEMHASIPLASMARVVKPQGKVIFSGITKNFKKQNPLIRLLYFIGLNRLAENLYSLIYLGAFNAFDREEWHSLCEQAGLDIIQYDTYVPYQYSMLFDLAYRPETILLNFFGWTNWLTPLSRNRLFRKWLVLSSYGMQILSQGKKRNEGVNFFIVAQKQDTTTPQNTKTDLVCSKCHGELENKNTNQMVCKNCNTKYHIIDDIPCMLIIEK